MTREIPLGHGVVALVDDADYERVAVHHWCLYGGRPGRRYAGRKEPAGTGRQRTVYLHRFILGLGVNDEIEVDHINMDRLDCRRQNLRLATASQNGQNRAWINPTSRTGLRGVEAKANGRFRAVVFVRGRRLIFGTFATPEEAARAAAEGRKTHHSHAPESDGRAI